MNKYSDMELNILTCIFEKPQLIEQLKIDDEKYIIKHKRIWKFMKAFYEKYKCFDTSLMCSVCKQRWQVMEYINIFNDTLVFTNRFDLYQQQLVELYNEGKKEKWIINKIDDLTNMLILRKISTEEYRSKLNTIYSDAEEIFKEK